MSGTAKRLGDKFIYLSPPHMSGYEERLVSEALASNWIAPQGLHVDAFEREIARYAGVKGAVALSSGTAAIHLALKLLGVGPGDPVFCSSFTFVGSANPILYLGAEPVFIDSEPASWNMSPVALEKAFVEAERTGRFPRAVVVVDIYGQCADYRRLSEICQRYGVPIIEDAAEALGAVYSGQAAGSWGRFGVFSFNGNKIITTSGGGMLVSDDLEALEKARYWAAQSREPAGHYQHSEMGYNYRLSNILAAIGRGQLRVLDERVKARRSNFFRYLGGLSDIDGIEFMPEINRGFSTRWLTAAVINQGKLGLGPAHIGAMLARHNIETRPVWKPMHLQPLFKGCAFFSHLEHGDVCGQLFKDGICLPSGSNLTEHELDYVIKHLKKCIASR